MSSLSKKRSLSLYGLMSILESVSRLADLYFIVSSTYSRAESLFSFLPFFIPWTPKDSNLSELVCPLDSSLNNDETI